MRLETQKSKTRTTFEPWEQNQGRGTGPTLFSVDGFGWSVRLRSSRVSGSSKGIVNHIATSLNRAQSAKPSLSRPAMLAGNLNRTASPRQPLRIRLGFEKPYKNVGGAGGRHPSLSGELLCNEGSLNTSCRYPKSTPSIYTGNMILCI